MTGSILNGFFGGTSWTPVSGDFDGDGKSDVAVYNDGNWSIYLMTGSILNGFFGGVDWDPVQ